MKTKRRKDLKWRAEFYWQAYKLAREGLTDGQIAQTFGVSPMSVLNWKKRRPAFKAALEEGRSKEKSTGVQTLSEYILGRLEPDMKEIWEEMMAVEEGNSTLGRVEKMINRHGTVMRQKLFLHAWMAAGFNWRKACAMVNVHESVFKYWCANDEAFSALFNSVQELKGDFFEGALVQLVNEGHPHATIFANRTFNAKRGYSEKLQVEHQGEVTQNINVVDLTQLGLDLETKRKIVKAIREKEEQDAATRH